MLTILIFIFKLEHLIVTIGLGSTLGTTSHMVVDATGAVTKPLQPAFQVGLSSSQDTFATSTDVTVLFANEIFDNNSDFNTSNYTFTAPVTGRYQLNVSLRLNHVDNGAAFYQMYFISSNRTYTFTTDSDAYINSDLAYQSFAWSVLADMDASDTVYVRIYQSGGTQQTDVAASAHSIFSGFLVC